MGRHPKNQPSKKSVQNGTAAISAYEKYKEIKRKYKELKKVNFLAYKIRKGFFTNEMQKDGVL